ncbi:hypothetical protein BGZ97_011788 [Linnemannia gamsii]|uniref:Uncharacterized protein n=1 Tax=Linnemannia gamsii TaxID=64522 RepID=A0A9P6UMQ8_9FUNG|nr:hypothetical protein BGZ97_011788 [Linnemannia gamsii]
MYTIGCNFDRAREADTCRAYEYSVDQTCVLNYCSKDVPCYAGTCDTKHQACVNMTSTRVPLPPSINQIITLDDSPFGLQKDEEAISGVTLVKVPAKFNSAHWLPSTDSLDYATPLPSPQVTTFAQDLNSGSSQSHSHASLNGESSAAIEMETRSFLNDLQDPTTSITTAIDSSRRLSNKTHMLGQTEELSMLAGERAAIARSMTVSHTNDSEGSELQKSRSLHVSGSKALRALPQLPAVATMKGSCSSAVAISPLSNDVSPPPLSSPKSPKAPKSARNGRAAHLRLNVPSPSYIASEPPSGSTTPTVPYYSRSSSSLSGSPSSPGGFLRSRRVSLTSSSQGGRSFSNSPIDRKLPSGFASSPIAKTTERFE